MTDTYNGGENMVNVGDKVKCIFMDDPFPVPSGTVGIVKFIDSIGQIHVSWENGSSLALNPRFDRFEVVK